MKRSKVISEVHDTTTDLEGMLELSALAGKPAREALTTIDIYIRCLLCIKQIKR
jgi:hypothetical protein